MQSHQSSTLAAQCQPPISSQDWVFIRVVGAAHHYSLLQINQHPPPPSYSSPHPVLTP